MTKTTDSFKKEDNMNQFQANPIALARGLMIELAGQEPMMSDAGLFIMVGQLAYAVDVAPDVRLQHLSSLLRITDVASECGMVEWARDFLLVLFAEGVSPLEESDRGNLLATLARLVAISVGPGRMVELIKERPLH
jgi:hypothetical protein